eukprot:Partr_v1_DN24489_c0_g1_i3_m66359 putative phosphatidylethanolamine N-methyltransferase
MEFDRLVDFKPLSFWLFILSTAFNPLFWNIVARQEYKTGVLTRYLGCGNKYAGCYALALTIFSLGIFRDYLFKMAIQDQPSFADMYPDLHAVSLLKWLGAAYVVCGNILVLSSMYKLGVTGTYLGDYFGILMESRVTTFPFNLMENPMYTGSTMIFAGTAFWNASMAGILMSGWVWLVYQVALGYEGPFTAEIYRSHSAAASEKPSRRKKKI